MTTKMALAGLQKSVANRPSSVKLKIGVRAHGEKNVENERNSGSLEMNGVVQKVGVAVEKGEDDTCQQAGDSER